MLAAEYTSRGEIAAYEYEKQGFDVFLWPMRYSWTVTCFLFKREVCGGLSVFAAVAQW